MIDISMLAPSAALPATPAGNAPAQAGQAPTGAAGFLRLFEIVIGGMPKPGSTDTALDLGATEAPASVDSAALPGAVLPTTVPGSAASAVDPTALLEGLVQGPTMDAASSARISDLLQSLGFDVSARQIAELPPLDRLQLDQAMEFIQRGLEAGMPTNLVLENASFLMPREWDYDGSATTVAPRTEHLASGEIEPDGADPATLLAASEAVRQILSSSAPIAGTLPKNPERPSVAAGRESSDPVALVGNHSAQVSTPATPASAAGAESAAPATRPAETATVVVRSPEAALGGEPPEDAARTEKSASLPVVARTAGPNDERSGKLVASTAPVAKDSTETVSAKPAARGLESAPATAARIDASSQVPVASRLEATATPMLPAAVASQPVETRATQVQGVKPGSMASEFIGRQVLEKVDVHLKQGKRELSVRLWPEELGEVRLSLRIGEADKLDARILVQTESVRQAILDATPQLREALSRNGMEMGRLSVNVEQDRGGFQNAGGERRENSRERSRQRVVREGWADEEFDYAAPLALGIDSGIRDGRNTLDMWS